MFRRILIFMMVASIPAVSFITVRQVYRYNQVDRQVKTLIRNQRDLFEQNKRMVANISILSSPERIDNLASEDLGLRKKELKTLRIELGNKGGSVDKD